MSDPNAAKPGETTEERRARKARVKPETLERVTKEVDEMLGPLPEDMSFNDLQLEHSRLREKIMEIQSLAIQGKFDIKKSQEFERILVEKIHKVEERASQMQTGRHVPKPGE
jgi:hypothetical protein